MHGESIPERLSWELAVEFAFSGFGIGAWVRTALLLFFG
jgi:hypothetical protein